MPDKDDKQKTRRTGSVFRGAPVDDSGAGLLLDEQLRQYKLDQETIQRGSSSTGRTLEEERRAKRSDDKAEREVKDANRERMRGELRASRAEKVYIDGRLVETYVIEDEDGVQREVVMLGGYDTDGHVKNDLGPTLATADRAKFEGRRAARSATYGILGISDLDEDATFIMSKGALMNEDGRVEDPVKDGENDPRRQAILQQREYANATNMMTLAGGVTWFRNLAQANPELYDHYIDLLVKADYLTEEDARKGAYTLNAGRQFAYAAADASQNVAGGGKDDLPTFLQKMAASVSEANEAAQKQAYTPVNRSYNDPELLSANARAAAEDLLGRSLNDEELARFQSKFRGLEDGYYDQIDAAGQAGTGARIADPNAGGQAEAFVRSPEFDEDRTRQLTGSYMDALNQMLGG